MSVLGCGDVLPNQICGVPFGEGPHGLSNIPEPTKFQPKPGVESLKVVESNGIEFCPTAVKLTVPPTQGNR